MARKWSRLPYVRKDITTLIPEVRRRNQKALIDAGAESCLLYLPNGVDDLARWDHVRQTYKNDDKKYRLYLNQSLDDGGQRLYTNDTYNVPSILIAFPANPDNQIFGEAGIYLSSRTVAWTLWDPIIPERGTIVRRVNNKQQEWWLVSNVVVSYWANYDKDSTKILHQEFTMTPITDDSGIDVNDFPSVEDTLAVYKNDLTYSTDTLSLSGTISIQESEQRMRIRGSGSFTQAGSYLNNAVQFLVIPSQLNGICTTTWGSWSDSSQPSVTLDFDSNQIEIRKNSLTIVKTFSYSFTADTQYKVHLQLKNGRMTVYINDEKIGFYEFRADTDYSTLQPLSPSNVSVAIQNTISTDEFYFKDFYILGAI